MADRVSQETVEVVYTTTGAKARVSQEVAEVLYATGAARARVSQEVVEVLGKFPTNTGNRVSQVAVEVLLPTKMIQPVFAGTSSLSANLKGVKGFAATFAGSSSLAVTVTTSHGNIKNFTVSLAGTSSLSTTLRKLHRFNLTLAGASSLVASLGGMMDNFAFGLDGVGQLRFGPPGLVDLSPVVFSGTSSLTAGFKLGVTLAGRSSLTVNLRRVQFLVSLRGFGTLTVFGDLGPTGARVSQVTNEVAYIGVDPPVLLSQLTLEVVRPRTGLHVWVKF